MTVFIFIVAAIASGVVGTVVVVVVIVGVAMFVWWLNKNDRFKARRRRNQHSK